MTIWTGMNVNTGESYDSNSRYEPPWQLGLLPEIIRAEDTRGVVEQVNANYAHGGGWNFYGKDKWSLRSSDMSIKYPEDPRLQPQWRAVINKDETVYIYDYGLVLLLASNGTFEISRMD